MQSDGPQVQCTKVKLACSAQRSSLHAAKLKDTLDPWDCMPQSQSAETSPSTLAPLSECGTTHNTQHLGCHVKQPVMREAYHLACGHSWGSLRVAYLECGHSMHASPKHVHGSSHKRPAADKTAPSDDLTRKTHHGRSLVQGWT